MRQQLKMNETAAERLDATKQKLRSRVVEAINKIAYPNTSTVEERLSKPHLKAKNIGSVTTLLPALRYLKSQNIETDIGTVFDLYYHTENPAEKKTTALQALQSDIQSSLDTLGSNTELDEISPDTKISTLTQIFEKIAESQGGEDSTSKDDAAAFDPDETQPAPSVAGDELEETQEVATVGDEDNEDTGEDGSGQGGLLATMRAQARTK